MIGFLRFVGILNAAVWFGTAIFFTFGAGLAPFSPEMKNLLGPGQLPLFLGGHRPDPHRALLSLSVACAVVAVLHLLAEWLYLGKSRRNCRSGLLIGLCSAALSAAIGSSPG